MNQSGFIDLKLLKAKIFRIKGIGFKNSLPLSRNLGVESKRHLKSIENQIIISD